MEFPHPDCVTREALESPLEAASYTKGFKREKAPVVMPNISFMAI